MKININAFTGMAPKLDASLLPNSAAQIASNVKLITGALAAVNMPKLEATTIITGAMSVAMLGAVGAAIPLSWATDVDVATSPLADFEYRVYYTGDSAPKKTSLALANVGPGPFPAAWYNLGVPGPIAAPTAPTASGTGAVPAGTYLYCFTYVAQFGSVLLEESAPSAASALVTVNGSQGVALSNLPSPAVTAGYNYLYKRVYRTTGTTFQLVEQIALATTSYTDTRSATGILGDALATLGWTPPPSDLKGITALPSSVLVGYRNNEVWFSEPGFPHAWPVAYMQAIDAQIVGLKAFGNNVVLGTQSFPYMGSGVHPDSFNFAKLPMLEPCLSKRSMAADEFGVLYASSNGLVAVGNEVTGLISKNFVSRESFAAFAPATFTACVFERRYYGFFDSTATGAGAFVFSRDDPAPVSSLTAKATAVTIDPATARMLFTDTDPGKLWRFDPPDTVPSTYTWKSKLFLADGPINFGCFRIRGAESSTSDISFAADLAARNAAIAAANTSAFSAGGLSSALNESAVNALELDGSTLQTPIPSVGATVGVTVWAGANVVLTGDYSLNTVYRLPSGFRKMGWEISVTGQRNVRGVQMAISPGELGDG